MGARCDVAMLVDAEVGEWLPSGQFLLDRGSMEVKVLAMLRSRYSNVVTLPFGPDVLKSLKRLDELRPRMVFNLTEWLDGDRTLDHAIAGMLELLRLPFTGTGQIGLQICRDKGLSKQIVASVGVDVPHGFSLPRRAPIRNQGLAYPFMVKPQVGDGSDGVSKESLVGTPTQFRRRVMSLRSRFNGPVLCEEYVPGRDIYVGVLGNRPRVLAPTEMVIESRRPNAPKFATYRLKNDGAYRSKWRVRYRLADLPSPLLRKVRQFGAAAFLALKLRDYARLDFRLTDEGRLVFLEANPNPDLTPHTLGQNLCFVGVDYHDLIPRIVEIARRRYQRGAAYRG